jgi:hypothetical protein
MGLKFLRNIQVDQQLQTIKMVRHIRHIRHIQHIQDLEKEVSNVDLDRPHRQMLSKQIFQPIKNIVYSSISLFIQTFISIKFNQIKTYNA